MGGLLASLSFSSSPPWKLDLPLGKKKNCCVTSAHTQPIAPWESLSTRYELTY